MNLNNLYLPELREMLANHDVEGLREFCAALHPARTVEFMLGLDSEEMWQVLAAADPSVGAELFSFLPLEKQIEIALTTDRGAFGALLSELPSDDRVDLLKELDDAVVDQLLPLLPLEERRDIQRLYEYPEGTAGSVMTTEFASVPESYTVREAFETLSRQTEDLETVYYVYVVDDGNQLRGLVSARQLVSYYGRPETPIKELMQRELVTVEVDDDQEVLAQKVADYDLVAIPVVDDQRRLLGIVTHDDVIDVVLEEAVEDAHQIGAIDPLEERYLDTHLWTLTWKRGLWLTFLFLGALLTAFALQHYDRDTEKWVWLGLFVPMVISSGGNSGSQSATLVIAALKVGHLALSDWWQVIRRELAQGVLLGAFLGLIGFVPACFMTAGPHEAVVVPITVLLVVICGTLVGSILPLLFQRLGFDPAIMSTPFVAGIIDLVGIVIYMNVAIVIL